MVTPVRPERARRTEQRRLRRRLRGVAVVALVGTAAAAAFLLPQATRSPGGQGDRAPLAPPAQSVVAWAVWDQRRPGSSFVAVLAAGGGLDPVAVAVPGNAAVSIPGHGLGTVDDAAATGDITTVAATVENVLGVQVDEGWGIPLPVLRNLVDGLGTVPVEGRSLDGSEVVAYLREPSVELSTERAIRWQALLMGLIEVAEGAAAADLNVPEAVRPVFAAPETEVLALPVEDVGAGLARPDAEAVSALVTERFVPTGGETKIRLVVLNGNGEPGVGLRVARLLVPQGYQLVASQNASEFGMNVTKIIASDRGDLPAARKAQRLLGVGRVLLGSQDSGVADVTVVVGQDFGGP
ncbi:MAG: LCP family protein [Actinomycetota bacterium]